MNEIAKGVKEVISISWPVITLTVVILMVLKEKFIFHQEILSFVFIVYILCLFQLVTSQDLPGEHGINIIPFKEISRYAFGSRLFFRNVVGNIILFMPFGFLTSYYLDLEKKRYNILITLLISVIIEFIQLSIGRAFDIDDIILNIVGSFIGCLMYRVIDRIFENKSEVLKGNITIGLMLLMIFGLLLVIL